MNILGRVKLDGDSNKHRNIYTSEERNEKGVG